MDELAQLIADLVALDSVNPDLVPGGAGEGELAGFVADWMRRAGLETHVEEVLPGRPNVIGVARGRGGGPALLLNGHTDTVGGGGMADPWRPRIEGRRLHGRGAYDMKAGLAAAMLVAAGARGQGLAGDVLVAAVCDEEMAGLGTRALLERWRADAAVVTEPTELAVGIAHKGFVGFRVETEGVAAHGSMPELGRDAIAEMGPVLMALRGLEQRLRETPGHPLLGRASVHASLIGGGQEFSSYPARCVMHGEIRTVPGMDDPDELLRESVLASGAEARLTLEVRGDALETHPEEPIARTLLGHAGTEARGLPYWTDAAQLAAAGIPTVLFGPAGHGAHGDDEWVDLDSAERVREVLAAVAADFCGRR